MSNDGKVGYGYDNGMGIFGAAGEQGAREGLKQALVIAVPVALFWSLVLIKQKRSLLTGRKKR